MDKRLPELPFTARFSLKTLFGGLISRIKQEIESCMPVSVLEYHADSDEVTVQPIVKRPYTQIEGVGYDVRTPFRVRVRRICHGGFMVYSPIEAGDTGWVIAADRDTFRSIEANSENDKTANKGPQNPETFNTHLYIYGFFIPDSWAKPSFSEGDESALVISNSNGTENATATIKIHKNGAIDIQSSVGITVNGDATVNGDVICTGDVTADAVSLKNHVHKVTVDGTEYTTTEAE